MIGAEVLLNESRKLRGETLDKCQWAKPRLAPNHLLAWGTHVDVLRRYVVGTAGPVLELGAGIHSTPLLHELCESRGGRTLLTADDNPMWISCLAGLKTPWHEIELVGDWETWDGINRHHWAVALVDHARPRRVAEIKRLRTRTDYILVHDSEGIAFYGYDRVFGSFRYEHDYEQHWPPTRVLSDTRPPLLDPSC